MKDESIPAYKFGDIVANHWAGDANPTKRGVVMGTGYRGGRVNSGPHVKVRSVDGRISEYKPSPALEVIGTIYGKTEAEVTSVLVARDQEPKHIEEWRHKDWHRTYDQQYVKCPCNATTSDAES